jgi:hypothetical protein
MYCDFVMATQGLMCWTGQEGGLDMASLLGHSTTADKQTVVQEVSCLRALVSTVTVMAQAEAIVG